MLMSHQDSEGNVFESFTDMILCICIVLVMLVVLLALNVNKKVEELTKPNVYSGGVNRPELFVDVHLYDYQNHDQENYAEIKKMYGVQDSLHFALYSPSRAEAKTTVKDGKVISSDEDESFSGSFRGEIDRLMAIAPGIEMGAFKVGGTATSLVIPKFVGKSLVVDGAIITETNPIAPSKEMGGRLLSWAWSAMSEKIYPVRGFEEYRHSRCIIYFESRVDKEGGKYILIGNTLFRIPQAIKDGRLDFLTSLSSSLTEMVYLGEFHLHPEAKSNTRIDMLRGAGYNEAADYYIKFIFDRGSLLPSEYKELVSAWPTWDVLWSSSDQSVREKWIKNNGSIEEAKNAYENLIEKRVVNSYIDMKLVRFLKDGYKLKDIPKGYLPPFVQFPEANQAYIKHRMDLAPKTPDWVLEEVLIPLGYDKKALDDEVVQLRPRDEPESKTKEKNE